MVEIEEELKIDIIPDVGAEFCRSLKSVIILRLPCKNVRINLNHSKYFRAFFRIFNYFKELGL